MDLQSLNIFIQVAELNSFTKAGEKLGYSQPTVSFQIKQLEKELGVPLFDRIGHTVSLTEAGKDALSYAQRICHMSEEMVLGVSRRQEVNGIVRIAMADSLCTPMIENRLVKFRKKYPKVALHITTAGTDEMLRLVNHNEVDVVCTMDRQIYDTSYVIVNEEKIGVHFIVSSDNILAKKEKIKVYELLSHPFLLTEKGMSYRKMLDETMARYEIELQPVLEIGDADMICRLVEKDLGISFLPDYVTEEAVRKNKVARLNVEDFEISVWKQLLYRRDKWVSLQMKALMEHLSEEDIEK